MSDIISQPPAASRLPRKTGGGFALLLLLGIAATARLAWLAILPSQAVALDFLTWKWVALDLLNHVNPYSSAPFINHPPFWTEVIFGLANLSRSTGVDFIRSVRFVLIAGDLCALGRDLSSVANPATGFNCGGFWLSVIA